MQLGKNIIPEITPLLAWTEFKEDLISLDKDVAVADAVAKMILSEKTTDKIKYQKLRMLMQMSIL